MQVFARLVNGQILTLEVESDDTVEMVCDKIAAKHPQAHPDLQTLALNGRVLRPEDGGTMADYGVHIETTFTLGVRAEELEIVLNVGGKRYSTLLSTLLASPGSRIHAMFVPMLQGSPASFARSFARGGENGGGGGGRASGVAAESVPHQPAGPLPRSKDGAYLIDRNGKYFAYILDFLRSGEPVLPRDAEQRSQLAKEARYYGLGKLADACASPVWAVAVASGVGYTAADILALTDAERKTVCEEQGVGLLDRKRLEAEVQLRQKLGTAVSEPSVCALVASGQTVGTMSELNAAAAVQLGLNEDDAHMVGKGDVGLELCRDLARYYNGTTELSKAALRVIVGARLTLAEVRKLDGAAALGLGLSSEDVRKVLWESEAGVLLRQRLRRLELSEAGMDSLIAAGLAPRDVRSLDAAAARALGLSQEDALKANEFVGEQEFVFQGVDNSVGGHGKFDQAGVLNHIGTAGGTRAWVNPCTSGDVSVAWSHVYYGPVEMFVSKWDCNGGTGACSTSWMRVDLGATRSLVVRHYALRHTGNISYALRNWEFQGANVADGPWTTLRRHDNDASIETKHGGFFVAAWAVEGASPFRFFRIHSHGPDSGDSGLLMCAGIELYGMLTEE